jgi:small-conductance mechanosensitive channel
MLLAAIFLAFAAFTAIAASMERHQDQLGTERWLPARLQGLRLGGYALLAVSLLPCLARWNASVGVAAWLGLLSFSAMGLGLLLTYAPQWGRRLAPVAAAAGLLAWALAA